MECASGFIGIRQACASAGMSAPKSGLFIEDLEGISVKNLEGINGGKYDDAVDLVNRKTMHAARLVTEELRAYISPTFREELVLETGFGGKFETEEEYTALLDLEYGLRASMINNNLRELRLEEIFLLFEGDFSKEIEISDGVATIKINEGGTSVIAKAGEVTRIPVDFVSSNGQIDISYNGLGVSSRNGTTSSTQFLRSCSHCGSLGFENFTVKGIAGESEDEELYGVRARFSIDCSMEKALCLSLSRLKMAILYRVGIEILKEWEASDRMNWLTIHSRDWALEKRAEWEEITYPNLMKTLSSGVAHFLKKVDKNCLNCGGTTYGYTHP